MFKLVITVRKDVETQEQALVEFEWVKQKLQSHPEVVITGHVTNHFDREEIPE